MRLYELTLVVNRLQEKAIRDVFDQHSWKFIIAGEHALRTRVSLFGVILYGLNSL